MHQNGIFILGANMELKIVSKNYSFRSGRHPQSKAPEAFFIEDQFAPLSKMSSPNDAAHL
jgi:hypothetical protein